MYTVTAKVADGSFPRHYGSTLLTTDRLKVAYNRYETTAKAPGPGFITFNLIFAHGTGMNKSLWKYYVDKLYEYSARVGPSQKWYIKSVLCIDSASHGDSALLNEGKLGWQNRWEDGGRDINAIVKQEQLATGDFINDPTHKNIIISHSLGSCQSVFAVVFEPTLYDLAFMIETVGYTDDKSNEVFYKLIMRMGGLILDEFDSEKEIDTYLKKLGVMKKFHPQILQDIVDDEKYVVTKPNGEKKWRTKASAPQQLTSYMSGVYSIPAIMRLLPSIRTPVVHVGALKGKFNPPATIPFIRENIPKEYITGIDIANGEHNVNGELPDVIIKEIEKSLTRRAELAHENQDFYAEIKYNGDRDRIFKEKWKILKEGGFRDEDKPKL